MHIHSLNFGRGMDWITEGFGLFRRNPLIWIVIGVLYIVLSSIISLIPGIGAVALTLVTPVLSAGLMAGCRDLDRGDELRVEHLFEGFRHNTQTLLMVGLLTLAGYFVAALVGIGAFLLLGGAAAGMGMLEGDFPASNSPEALPMMGGMLVAVLVILALVVPVAMAAWFAPPLVWFRNLPALEAMRQSFIGCWRNILPFLLYGLAAFVLLVIAIIPFGLGFLVLGPTLVGSVYAAYQDIYGDTD